MYTVINSRDGVLHTATSKTAAIKWARTYNVSTWTGSVTKVVAVDAAKANAEGPVWRG